MKEKIKEICNKLNREQLSVHGATEELLNLFSVSKSVRICPRCNGNGWTIPTDRVQFDCEECGVTGQIEGENAVCEHHWLGVGYWDECAMEQCTKCNLFREAN